MVKNCFELILILSRLVVSRKLQTSTDLAEPSHGSSLAYEHSCWIGRNLSVNAGGVDAQRMLQRMLIQGPLNLKDTPADVSGEGPTIYLYGLRASSFTKGDGAFLHVYILNQWFGLGPTF